MGTIMTRSAAEFWWGEKLPAHIAYLTRNHPHENWIETTYKQILEKKVENQQWELSHKRTSEIPNKRAAYIWVFCNYNTDLFGGWYCYIKTLTKDYAITFRHETNWEIVLKAMQLHPCGVIPAIENFDAWCEAFSKQYKHKGFKRKKYQGIVKCWCYIDDFNNIKNIS